MSSQPDRAVAEGRKLRINEALREAIALEMRRDPSVFVMGEDIATYGGVFQVTSGLLEEFGPERVRETPISETAIVGAAIGAAIQGLRPIAEIMYTDFLPLVMNQLATHLSYIPDIWGIPLPLVLRSAGGVTGASIHSRVPESWIANIPGVVLVAPSTPEDAKGLLISAIRNDRPVVFLENRAIYQRRGLVPEGDYETPIGKAAVRREGSDITLIAWSRMALEAEDAAGMLADDGISTEVIDLRSLVPFDVDTVVNSVAKTGRAAVIHEAWRKAGFGAEVAARITEEAFEYLDGPVLRLGGLDKPVPFSPAFLPVAIPLAPSIADSIRKELGR